MVVDLFDELRGDGGDVVEDLRHGVFRSPFYDLNPDSSRIEEP